MSQLKVTLAGLRFRDVAIKLNGNDTDETYLSDVVNNIELLHSTYMESKTGSDYIELSNEINKFLAHGYSDVIDLLDTQVTNYDLTQIGWNFLRDTVLYLVDSSSYDSKNLEQCKRLDRSRTRIGHYFVSKTFKASDVDSLTQEEMESIRESRQAQLDELRESSLCVGNNIDITSTLSVGLYGDRCLLDNFVKLLLID